MHFLYSDLIGLSIALVCFPFLTILPGYALGIVTNVLTFKEESAFSRLIISLILSISVFPVIYYWILKTTHVYVVWVVLLASLGIVLQYLIFLRRPGKAKIKASRFIVKSGLILLFFWGLLAILIIDVEIGGRLLSNLMVYDYVKHIAVSDAISRTGVPPVNPSFYPGEPLNLFYYYFWFVFPSLVDQIGIPLITSRHAVFAGVLWFSLGLGAITWQFIRRFGPVLLPDISSRHYPWILSLLAVTGLDLVPIITHRVLELVAGIEPYKFPSIELWNEQVTSWFCSVIWVSHHVSALVATLFVFILFREAVDIKRYGKQTWTSIILCSLAMASALGMSVWVTLVFVCFLAAWFVFTVGKGWKAESILLIMLGAFSFTFVLPFVLELQQSSHMANSPIEFSVRAFTMMDQFITSWNPILLNALRLLILPINYILELGIFLMGGLFYVSYRRSFDRKMSISEQYVLFLLFTSLIVCTFFKANIKYNDLGWRGFMFAQMILLVYSAPLYLSAIRRYVSKHLLLAPVTRAITLIVLILGFSANIYEMSVLRFYSPLSEGDEGVALRELYNWVDENTPKDAIFLHNPDEQIEFYHALYGHRQVILADKDLGKLYGISDEMYEPLYWEVTTWFNDPVLKIDDLRQKIDSLGVDFIVVKNDDPVWEDSLSWLEKIEPVFKNNTGRVYQFTEGY